MKVWADARPYEVDMMARVLGAFCEQHGIVDQVERDKVAARLVALYELGVTQEDDLLAQLKQVVN